jgi:predicted dehydrogenase
MSNPQRPLRALIVGLGSIGRRHARNWAAAGYGPLAICRQRNASQPEPLGVEAAIYADLDQALEGERPDVVLVTNPTSLHVATACAALQAGAHVFVEKPLDCREVGVQELLHAASRQKRVLMVGYNLRFHPGLKRLKALIEAGAIGKIVSARAEAGEYLPDWHPWEDYRQGYSARADQGGGAILTFSHELDSLCWLLGRPRQVTAMASHASALEVSTEDVAEIVLQFEAGVIGSVHVDYVRRAPRRSVEVVGENGIVRWDYQRNRLEVYAADTDQWRVEEGDPGFERNQMYRDELAHFVECVRGHAEPSVNGEQGAAVMAVALAALRSAAEGRSIDLAHGVGSNTQAWLDQLNSQS